MADRADPELERLLREPEDTRQTRGERLGTSAYVSLVVGHLVTDSNRRNLVELIHYMLELERRRDTAARQAGELLAMSRKLNELYDS